jgi:hypothetical protein
MMAAPPGSFSRPFTRTEPTRPSKEPVLAVGWNVLLRSATGSADRVELTDEDGTASVASLKPGIEVEITAWRPRRAGPALYRVRTVDGTKEGWVSASSLEQKPAPPPPKPLAAKAPAKVPAKTAAKAPASKTPTPAAGTRAKTKTAVKAPASKTATPAAGTRAKTKTATRPHARGRSR